MTLDNTILLSLAEVCATFTGFIGIVVVLGRRAQGDWSAIDNIRFWTLLTTSGVSVALALLPVLFGPNSFAAIGLGVGGGAALFTLRQAALAIKHPDGDTKLALSVIAGFGIIFSLFIASVSGIVPVSIHQSYLAIILWNLTISIVFFIRLLRSTHS